MLSAATRRRDEKKCLDLDAKAKRGRTRKSLANKILGQKQPPEIPDIGEVQGSNQIEREEVGYDAAGRKAIS